MMTEDEIKQIEQDIGEVGDPRFELAWAERTLKDFEAQEKQLKAEFRMWKFTRRDNMIQQVQANLKTVRGCMDYLKKRLEELNGDSRSSVQ